MEKILWISSACLSPGLETHISGSPNKPSARLTSSSSAGQGVGERDGGREISSGEKVERSPEGRVGNERGSEREGGREGERET